jgi:hypothetical protein
MRTLSFASIAFAAAALAAGSSFADDSATVPLRPDATSNSLKDSALLDSGSSDSGAGTVGDYFDNWFARVKQAQDSQPHWMTPLATVTPRLEQEFRYDQYWERAGNGASIDTLDSGKGLELIPTTTNEVLINLPTYEDRYYKKPARGWGDWPILTVKQRLLSSPEDQGNYIVSAFLGVQAPSGNAAYTNHSWLVTPTIAGGKGWGDFNIQATTGVSIPLRETRVIGYAIASNVAFQYHWAQYFWPEFEVNNTYWSGGLRDGKDQMFLTTGLILGRFEVAEHARLIVGAGYQFAVSPVKTTVPVLTPTYDHSWLLSVRVAF